MTPRQKIKRALFVSMSLVAGCLMVTTLGAAGIFLVQRGTDLLSNVPGWLNGLEIILASVSVNAFCVAVLLEISKADAKSVPLEKLSTSHH